MAARDSERLHRAANPIPRFGYKPPGLPFRQNFKDDIASATLVTILPPRDTSERVDE